jgi:hypothetical protein
MPTQSRTVRVFLSSTFRDFAEERDLLVRKIFPELRRKCRERQVELVDVDLRWGITEEEAQQGKVLPICLAEIDRSRPFFMGFIGDRYGWVPEKDQYDLSLIMEQSWLDSHRGGKSVTELEMLHGVLNNPAMEDRSFFYFRDSAYSQAKGGAYLSEGPQENAKLEALKARIRQSGFPVVENYCSPEDLAERVRDDLWKLIDEAFPESEVPDALARERMRHDAYSATRCRLYLGGEDYFKALDAAMKANSFIPVLVYGQSGGGKSALLANWVSAWSKRHPKTSVIVHHLGCGADAADPVRFAARLMQEIAGVTGDEFKPESDPDKLLNQLPEWLSVASAWAQRQEREFLIALDGLDKLSDRKHLLWFPSHLPPGVKLVVSCLDGEVLEAAKMRLSWTELKVEPFTKKEQERFIEKYLGLYRKSLTPAQTKLLLCHPLSGNPLFLLTVLEELRVFGVHEKLEARLQVLLSPPTGKISSEEPTVDDVFEHVIARIEEDLGKKPVQAALEAIWASRYGLFQDEILAIANLAPAQWAAIQNSLDESLYDSSGKINFGHDYLRKAVEDHYKLTGKKKLKIHRHLAEWFERQLVDARVAEELPWQWEQAGESSQVGRCLMQRDVFILEYKRDRYELWRYWLRIPDADIEFAYQAAINEWKINIIQDRFVIASLAEFLVMAGCLGPFTENLFRSMLSISEVNLGLNHSETLSAANSLGNFLSLTKDGNAAEILHRRVLKVLEDRLGHFYERIPCWGVQLDSRQYGDKGMLISDKHLLLAETLNYLGCALAIQGSWDTEWVWRRALEIRSRLLGDADPKTCDLFYNLSDWFDTLGKTSGAARLALAAYDGMKKRFGDKHPETIKSLDRVIFFDSLLGRDVENQLRTLLEATECFFGPSSYEVCCALFTLANVLQEKGDLSAGNQLGKRAEMILADIKGFAAKISGDARFSEAVTLLRRYGGGRHEMRIAVRYDLACYECLSGNLPEAKRLISEELAAEPGKKELVLDDERLQAIRELIEA